MQIVTNKIPCDVTDHEGKTSEVTIQLPTLRELPKYVDTLGDDLATVELLTGLPPEEVDRLTDESIFAICDKAAQVMHPRIAAWLDRQAAKIEAQKPIFARSKAATAKMEEISLSPKRQ